MNKRTLSPSGLTPIPKHLENQFASAEGLVLVQYKTEYRCAICGYLPPKFGCVPELERHLKERHSVAIEKPLWIDGLSDTEIRNALAPKGFDQPAQ